MTKILLSFHQINLRPLFRKLSNIFFRILVKNGLSFAKVFTYFFFHYIEDYRNSKKKNRKLMFRILPQNFDLYFLFMECGKMRSGWILQQKETVIQYQRKTKCIVTSKMVFLFWWLHFFIHWTEKLFLILIQWLLMNIQWFFSFFNVFLLLIWKKKAIKYLQCWWIIT